MEAQFTPAANTAVIEDSTHDPRAGYDYKFHDLELASEYNCHICLSVSQNPQQAKCCGATFCQYCIMRALESSKVGCPNCNEEGIELIPDKAQKQKINKLKVLCPIDDCGWVIELADIEAHRNKPHPLSPPITTPHSTLQRKQCQEQIATHSSEISQEQQCPLSISPPPLTDQQQSEKSIGQKPPMPTPRKQKPDDENAAAWTDYVNTTFSQSTASQEQANDSGEEIPDYLNVTLPRPRVPRNSFQSPPPDLEKHETPQYVNLDQPLSPTLPPLAHDQPPQPPQSPSQMQPSTDQPHRSQSPSAMSDEPNIYENVSTSPCALDPPHEHSASQPTTSTLAEVHVGDYLNITLPRPRVPRNRSQSPPPDPKRQKMSNKDQRLLPHSPSSPPSDQQLNQPVPFHDETKSHPPPQSPSLPNEMAAALPTPALDEFGLPPFLPAATLSQPPTTTEERSEYVNPEPSISSEGLISLPPHETSDNGELYTALPELPPDLLTLIPLLDEPPPQQNQMQPLTDQPSGFALSPSPPPGLQPPLLDLPLPFPNLLPPLPDNPQQSEPLVATESSASETVPSLQTHHQLLQRVDTMGYTRMSKPVEANQLDYVDMQHVDMQPLLITNQPECVDVPQPQESNQPEYTDMSSLLNANHPEANKSECVDVPQPQELNQPEYTDMSQLLNANCPEANQPENVVVSRSQEPNQPEYADVSDVPQLPNASHSDAQEASQPDYVDMSPPPIANELEYATVSQPSQTNQPEYADVSQPQEANECTTVARRRLPTPPPEENQSDTLPQSQPSENYATISVTVQSDDTDDHIYEPLPQPQEQTVYEIPLAPPPPPLPPREPPSTQPEPLPPLLPRSRSPTAEPTAAEPAETSPSLPTTHNETAPPPPSPAPPPQQPQTEVQSAAQQVLEGDRIQLELQRELQQGQANEPDIGESLPPRYVDLSQVPPYNVLTAQQTQAAAADPHQQVFVILNENTGTTQQIEGAIRAENVQIQYEMGDVHHRHKTTKKLRTVL